MQGWAPSTRKSCRFTNEKQQRTAWIAKRIHKRSLEVLVAKGFSETEAEAKTQEQQERRHKFAGLSPEEKQAKHRERMRTWHTANKDRLKRSRAAYFKQYRQDHSEYYSLACHKRRARLRKLGNFTLEEWFSLLEQSDHRCLCCKKRVSDDDFPPTNAGNKRLTKDHVIPICKGGANTIENIQPLCWPCHLRKGTTVRDYRVNSE